MIRDLQPSSAQKLKYEMSDLKKKKKKKKK